MNFNNFLDFPLNKIQLDLLNEYQFYLLDFNKRINLVSKRINEKEILILIQETLLLGKKIEANNIIDAGSGNGLIGIPLAIQNPKKKVVLVETVVKKIKFLKSAIEYLKIENCKVYGIPIQDFMRNRPDTAALVARGFPKLDFLAKYIEKEWIEQLLIISSPDKIKKKIPAIENVQKTLYNIPKRNHLVLCVINRVSRETLR